MLQTEQQHRQITGMDYNNVMLQVWTTMSGNRYYGLQHVSLQTEQQQCKVTGMNNNNVTGQKQNP